MMHAPSEPPSPLLGCLLGGAVGDALGLPAEGLSGSRIERMWHGEWKHRLVFGRGMISDDTEQALLTAAALVAHPDDSTAFQRRLARSLRWWLAALPAATGLATGRAILRLWCGFPPHRSGVRSAGNGPAMRSALIGVFFPADAGRRRDFVAKSCQITHADPRALEAALLVAEAGALAASGAANEEVLCQLRPWITSDEMHKRWPLLEQSLQSRETTREFAGRIGCARGISGFAPDTAAAALHAWLRHRGNFRDTLAGALECGGDTDTVGAICGSLAGTDCGEGGIPAEWITRLTDWPRSVRFVRISAAALQNARSGIRQRPPTVPWIATLLRNLIFLPIVLIHGLRRLLPP